jgi:hypothetical protein
LYNQGLLDQVNQMVKDQGGAIEIEWEYATMIHIQSAFVQEMAQQLNLSTADLQTMFDSAAKL